MSYKIEFGKMQLSAPETPYRIFIYDEVFSGYKYDAEAEKIKASETSADAIRKQLEKIPFDAPIDIFINSPGGSIKEGLGIYHQLKRHKGYKRAFIDGFGCSICAVIPQSCEEIIIPKSACMLVHNGMDNLYGNANEHRQIADDLDKLTKLCKNAILEKAGDKLTDEKLTELMDKGDFLSAEECLSYGLADKYASDSAGESNGIALVKMQSEIQTKQIPQAPALTSLKFTQEENAKALKAWNALLGAFSNLKGE